MKNVQVIALFLLLPHFLFSQLIADTYASAKENKSASFVYTYFDAPGYASKSASGKVEGICIDIMENFIKHMAKTEGIKITASFKAKDPHDFTSFLNEMKTAKGGVFGLSGTTITSQRQQIYNFSIPYMTNVGVLITNKSVPSLSDITKIGEQFANMTAVTVKNSTNENDLKEIQKKYFPAMKVEYEPSFSLVVDNVVSSNTKFSTVDFTYYLDAIKKRQEVKRHPGGDTKAEKFGIIMPKGSDWTAKLDEFLEEFLTNVEYRKILSKNLGVSAMRFMDSIE